MLLFIKFPSLHSGPCVALATNTWNSLNVAIFRLSMSSCAESYATEVDCYHKASKLPQFICILANV